MNRYLFATLLISPLLTLSAFAQVKGSEEKSEDERQYWDSVESIEKDLRGSLDELAALRKAIGEEKPAIALEANRIAAELREERRRADIARTSRDAVEQEFTKAEADLKVWKEERSYIESLLLDYRKNYESEQSIARVEAEADLLQDDSLAGRLALLDRSLSRLENSGTAVVIEGKALGEDGVLHEGTFAEAGPVSWFLSKDGSVSGLVTSDSDLRPRIVAGTADTDAIRQMVAGRPAVASFDPTLGSAVALSETEESLLEHIRAGGFWIYPILLLAAVALIAALAKWIQISRIKELRPGIVQRIIDAVNAGETEKAQHAVAEIRHPAGPVLARGIDLADFTSRESLEEALYETYLAAQPPLQRGLSLIAIASATAPLLGLLGTVTGMIETFRLINIFGTGDAKSLASGISEALVTTEFGLIVAIPALILHALLSRKVQGIRNTMEMSSLAFLNGIESREIAPPKPKPREVTPV